MKEEEEKKTPIPIGNKEKDSGWPLVGWFEEHPSHTIVEVLENYSMYTNSNRGTDDQALCSSCFSLCEPDDTYVYCTDCDRAYCEDCKGEQEGRCACGSSF